MRFHVNEELRTFRECFSLLEGKENKIILESFLLHARNLLDFLYSFHPKRSGDITVENFSVNLEFDGRSKFQKEIIDKIDKQLSHLTTDREIPTDLYGRRNEIDEVVEKGVADFNAKVRSDLILG